MNDGTALLKAVLSEPADDTVRLVYADWLEEHNEIARADAIRRGVKKPKRFTFAEGAPAVIAYTGKRTDIAATVQVELAHGWPGVRWTTYKGLLESATLTWGAWLAQDDELLQAFCLPEIILATSPDVTRIPNPSLVDGFREFVVPGRPTRHRVNDGEDPIAVVLAGEWPKVKRWNWPRTIIGRLDYRTNAGSKFRLQVDGVPVAKVGDIVQLADGTEGILMSAIDDDGRGLVMRPPRA